MPQTASETTEKLGEWRHTTTYGHRYTSLWMSSCCGLVSSSPVSSLSFFFIYHQFSFILPHFSSRSPPPFSSHSKSHLFSVSSIKPFQTDKRTGLTSEKNVSRSQGGETTPPSPLLTHSIIYQFKNKDFYVLLSVLPSILSSYYSHMLTLSHSTSHFSQCKTSVCLAKTKVLWISVGDFSPVCLFVFVCFYLFHHIAWIFFESVHV